jgi:predicted AAA+ superfamily ATPase
MDDKFTLLEKHNFWNGKVPNLGFMRMDYTEKILGRQGNNLVKVIVGQYRTGKSHILRQLVHRLIIAGLAPSSIFYINKELTDFDFITDYEALESIFELYLERLQPTETLYLILDEVQNIAGWEHFVKTRLQQKEPHCEIILCSSNQSVLSAESVALFSGKYVRYDVFPFGFNDFSGSEISKKAYLQYLASGALPELFSLPQESKRNYVSTLKDSILMHGIIQQHSIKDPRLLEDIFIYMINNVSGMVSINDIVAFFKKHNHRTTYDTVLNYIGYLEDVMLIHRVERFDVRTRETVASSFKFYVNDLSFKNYLYSWVGFDIDYKLENLVFLELRRSGYQVNAGVVRSKQIDFIAQKGDRVIYLQSANLLQGNTSLVASKYSPLKSVRDSFEKYIVSLDDDILPPHKGIRHIQAWNLTDTLYR